MTITVRKATLADLEGIVATIEEAKKFIHAHGIPQWDKGYPNAEVMEKDIRRGECVVLADEQGVCGTVTLLETGEPTYNIIYDGAWLTGDGGHYLAMHRVALADRVRGQGYGKLLVKAAAERMAEKGFESLRIDTHRDNAAMRRMLESSGFTHCGIIHLVDGAERVAYERK